jgi:guanylate kinase
VGKGSVVRELRARRPDLGLSVSATTRSRRPDEVDGVDYRFLDDAAFQRLVDGDGFLEWAEYAGRRYGTPADPVDAILSAGRDVVLEIEVQGARQIRERHPDAVLVLLVPPSEEVLAQRLRGRGTEDPDEVARRLRIAREELAQADLFDHVVTNDCLEDAVDELDRILDGKQAPDRGPSRMSRS